MGQSETRGKKRAFLEAYPKVVTVTGAAKVAGIEPKSHYRWLETDPAYKEAFAEAERQACDSVEQEIYRRGVVGWEEAVVYQGQFQYETDPTTGQRLRQVAIRKWSDNLLMFRAKKLMPEYRDRFEHTGPGGGPIPHAHTGALVTVPATADSRTFVEAMRKIQQAAAKAAGDGHGDGQPGGDGRG